MQLASDKEIEKMLRKLNAMYSRFDNWADVAWFAGVDTRTIRKWFSGECRPTIDSFNNVMNI